MHSITDQDDAPRLLSDTGDDDEVPELEPVAGPSSPIGERRKRDVYDRRKVPLTLLTGYLGAGKSTLLEYILTADHGYKIAVCMNDFGDTTDIESKSLTLTDPTTGEQTSQLLSLPNGCLCCSFKDMGIAAVEEMAHSQGVEWVVVELTGLADPGPIAKGFWENEEMGDLVLDGIVCVVDSRNGLKQLKERRDTGTNEAQRQVACADVILLNKTDLVDEHALQEVERAVREVNSTLRIHRTERSKMPLDQLFGIRSYSAEADGDRRAIKDAAADALRGDLDAVQGHEHTPDCGHEHGPGEGARHDSEVRTTLVPLPRLTRAQFTLLNDFLEILLWGGKLPACPGLGLAASTAEGEGVEVLRTKGLIVCEAEEAGAREWVLQGVTDLFELREVSQAQEPGGGTAGKVVFIGRNVEVLGERLRGYMGVE